MLGIGIGIGLKFQQKKKRNDEKKQGQPKAVPEVEQIQAASQLVTVKPAASKKDKTWFVSIMSLFQHFKK